MKIDDDEFTALQDIIKKATLESKIFRSKGQSDERSHVEDQSTEGHLCL